MTPCEIIVPERVVLTSCDGIITGCSARDIHEMDEHCTPYPCLPTVQETRDSDDEIRNGARQCNENCRNPKSRGTSETDATRWGTRNGTGIAEAEFRAGCVNRGGYGAADLVPGEVDEEAGLGLQVLAAGEADAVPEQLQRRVDEGQQPDGDDVPDKERQFRQARRTGGGAERSRGRSRRRSPVLLVAVELLPVAVLVAGHDEERQQGERPRPGAQR